MTQDPANDSPGQAPPRIVVIGAGNLLLKDEGIGIHAVKALQEMSLPDDVVTIDGGTSPDLIACTRAGAKLIIIDAAKAGGEPGTIYRFLPGDLASSGAMFTSAHELGVEENLKLMSLMKTEPPETVIIGVEPKEIDWGLELSPELQRRLPDVIGVVIAEIGLENEPRP